MIIDNFKFKAVTDDGHPTSMNIIYIVFFCSDVGLGKTIL